MTSQEIKDGHALGLRLDGHDQRSSTLRLSCPPNKELAGSAGWVDWTGRMLHRWSGGSRTLSRCTCLPPTHYRFSGSSRYALRVLRRGRIVERTCKRSVLQPIRGASVTRSHDRGPQLRRATRVIQTADVATIFK
jgi:hypothetical protein